LTVDRMARDGIELAEGLRRLLGQEKIILVGHSFGSILGGTMAKARPDLFRAFVATGLVADPARNYAVAYAAMLAHAKRTGNTAAVRELEAAGPPPYADGRGFMTQRKWANRFEGADRFLASMMGFAVTAPGYTAADINDWLEGQSLSGQQLVPQTAALVAKALGGHFALPVFVIQGAEDYTTPTSLAREFVAGLRAPRKAFVAIEDAGHFAAFIRPERFIAVLDSLVRPANGKR
jgi:pimeloyl-ACP methyl ester carboxylesterase